MMLSPFSFTKAWRSDYSVRSLVEDIMGQVEAIYESEFPSLRVKLVGIKVEILYLRNETSIFYADT